jgi:hypothetical protein
MSCQDTLTLPTAPSAPMQGFGYVNFGWTAPTSGTDVEYYEVAIEVDTYFTKLMVTPVNRAPIPWVRGQRIRVRVRGVDAAGRIGPWSEWSDAYGPNKLPERDKPPTDEGGIYEGL